jgi:beta-N-acetylhexosaminidase
VGARILKTCLFFVLMGEAYGLEACKTTEAFGDLSSWSVEDKIGQLLMIGLRSIKQIENTKPAGVVLFGWNMKSIDGTKKLTREIIADSSKKLRAPLFIATDHEGGKVLRLRKGMTPFPDASTVGSLNDDFVAFRLGKYMGLELSSLGINMNFAPVLDLGNAKSFLENRVWGIEAERVANLTMAYSRGLESSGVIPVAKHFPGHAGATDDAHFKLPQIFKSFEEIWKQDLLPFRLAAKDELPALMTAHVEMVNVDRGPASLSHKFVTDVLKDQIGYQGLIITDDLEMGGARGIGGLKVEEAAIKALKAGADLLLVVWSYDVQKRIKNRIVKALQDNELSSEWLDGTLCRILNLKAKYLAPYDNPYWRENLGLPESLKLASDSARRAIHWIAGDEAGMSARIEKNWDSQWNVLVPHRYFAQEWLRYRPRDQVRILAPKGDQSELEHFKGAISEAKMLVVVSGPRPGYDDTIFEAIMKGMDARFAPKDGPVYSTLWVHQGPQPVRIKHLKEEGRSGLLVLNGSTMLSFRAFMGWIKERSKVEKLVSTHL